jgi:hypothetical protein
MLEEEGQVGGKSRSEREKQSEDHDKRPALHAVLVAGRPLVTPAGSDPLRIN